MDRHFFFALHYFLSCNDDDDDEQRRRRRDENRRILQSDNMMAAHRAEAAGTQKYINNNALIHGIAEYAAVDEHELEHTHNWMQYVFGQFSI